MRDREMVPELSVVIAEDNRQDMDCLQHFFESAGHSVVAEVSSGASLIDAVKRYRPHLVVTDIVLEGIDGLSAIKIFSQAHQCAIVVVSSCNDEPTFELASRFPVQAYVLKPANDAVMSAVVPIALRRFEELENLRKEANIANRRLADRALVEKAKGVLIKRAQISEELAYNKIRTLARSSGQTMGQIANSLLLTDGVLSDLQLQPEENPSLGL
jgi:response regulator NasT